MWEIYNRHNWKIIIHVDWGEKLLLLGVTYFGDESMRPISWNTCNMWKTFKLGSSIYDKNVCTLL